MAMVLVPLYPSASLVLVRVRMCYRCLVTGGKRAANPKCGCGTRGLALDALVFVTVYSRCERGKPDACGPGDYSYLSKIRLLWMG